MKYSQAVQWGKALLLNQRRCASCPADGKIALVFPTGHAVGLNTTDGAEVLMHIGMDTVNLQGKGFKTLVEKGQEVKAGDPLVKFNIKEIKAAGYEVTTPVVVTNSKNMNLYSK